jgi:hypothetical protein
LNVIGSQLFKEMKFQLDEGSTYDAIIVTGRRPWYGLTISLTAANKSWTTEQQASWDDSPADPALDVVWRRYKLMPDWDQQQALDTSDGVREGGPQDGTRTWGDSESKRFQTGALALERMLPAGIGWTDSQLGSRQSPVVISYSDSSGHVDQSRKWAITLDGEDNTITLDDGENGVLIESWLAEPGGKIYVSLGIRAATPLQVWWERDQKEWPRQTPRVKYLANSDADQYIVLEGTFKSVDENGDPVKVEDDIVTKDDTSDLKDWLALARARYGSPAASISLSWVGGIDGTASTRPGVLWTSLTTADGNAEVNSVVTARRWRRSTADGVPIWETSYEARRILPELGGLR